MKQTLKLTAIITFLALCWCPAAVAEAITTVYLVRHAEKVADGSPDPALTDLGEQRARAFAALLRGKPVTHVFSTPYIRTRRSAMPAAREHGLEIEEYDSSDAEKFATRLKSLPGTILVTGHSNTVPELVNVLTGESLADLDDSVYDHVFIVSINQEEAATLRVEYTQPRTPAPIEFRSMHTQH